MFVGMPPGFVKKKRPEDIDKENIITSTDQLEEYKHLDYDKYLKVNRVRPFDPERDFFVFNPRHPNRVGICVGFERKHKQRFKNHGTYMYVGRKYPKARKYEKRIFK